MAVKVLDFGLAKVVQVTPSTLDLAAAETVVFEVHETASSSAHRHT